MSEQVIPKPDFMEEDAWNMLVATRNHEIIKGGSKFHVQQYLESDGEGDIGFAQGGPVLLVGTTGRKTGNEVISPVNYKEDGDTVVVVGSEAGLPNDPHWAKNLAKTPQAWIQIKKRRRSVMARKVTGQERADLWPQLTDYFPLWGHFQKYCDREFPVFILSPREGESSEVDGSKQSGES